MTYQETVKDIETTLGLMPEFLKCIPPDALELEWSLFKRVQLAETPVPNKYKELIGLGIAAATKCRYCTLFHTEVARLNGASEDEIRDALQYAKAVAGWSTWINGSQMNYENFSKELTAICAHVAKQQGVPVPKEGPLEVAPVAQA
ncbi:MAG TPA: carboxymuconolactone decarboxylase family protein [Aggregicoccus sp.]|nr:carboxymuconolactone decarboxylase family protein [Aggregicoccus sp.]